MIRHLFVWHGDNSALWCRLLCVLPSKSMCQRSATLSPLCRLFLFKSCCFFPFSKWLKKLPHYSLITKHKSPSKNGTSVHCTIEIHIWLQCTASRLQCIWMVARFSQHINIIRKTHTQRENPLWSQP